MYMVFFQENSTNNYETNDSKIQSETSPHDNGDELDSDDKAENDVMDPIVDDEDLEAMKKMGLPTSFVPAGVSMLSNQVFLDFRPSEICTGGLI